MPEPWPETGNRSLLRYKVFEVREARRTSPRTGADHGFFVVDTPDWVNVVGLTADGGMLLVEQYRHGTAELSLEIPGGLIDPGESPEMAAARELREETGYAAGHLDLLGTMTPNPAVFCNRCHTFLATGCRPDGALIQDSGEDLRVVVMGPSEVEAAVREGRLHHALALAGLYYHRLRNQRDRPR